MSDELFQNYPAGLLVFATTACIVFILVGIPGNLITIIALLNQNLKVSNANKPTIEGQFFHYFFPSMFLIKHIYEFCFLSVLRSNY